MFRGKPGDGSTYCLVPSTLNQRIPAIFLNLGNLMRILAIDVGQKRYGMAQSDPTQTIATGLGTFHQQEVFERLGAILEREPVEKLVVGWPLNLRGEESEATERVEAFVTAVKRKFPGLEIVKVDERFTTVMAQRSIIDSGTKKKKRQDKGLADTVAAAILLQGYLDRR